MGELILKLIYNIRLYINGIILRLLGINAKGIPLIDQQWRVYGLTNIDIGKNFKSGLSLRIQNISSTSKIIIGDNVNFNDRVHIACNESIIIGSGCLFASNILVTDHGHGIHNINIIPIKRPLDSAPVEIGEDVWIGENTVVYKGVKIGKGAIIGANSFVNVDVPDGAIFAGTPARRIR